MSGVYIINISEIYKGVINVKVSKKLYLHWTMSIMRLLIDGGTPFEAMHKYAPMCSRDTFEIVKVSPSTTLTDKK